MIGQREQHRRHGETDSGRYLFQQRLQQAVQQHGRTQQGEHAEDDPVLRHKEQRHRRDQHPCSEDRRAAPQSVVPQRHAEAGKQDEHQADGLLPQMTRRRGIPLHFYAEQEHQIPAGMIQHHADKVQSAQLVQQGVAARGRFVFGKFLHSHSPFVPHFSQYKPPGRRLSSAKSPLQGNASCSGQNG